MYVYAVVIWTMKPHCPLSRVGKDPFSRRSIRHLRLNNVYGSFDLGLTGLSNPNLAQFLT